MIPRTKKMTMTRLPFRACRLPLPFVASEEVCSCAFLCLLSMCHNSLAAVTLPSVPPIVSRMASSPMVCRPCMISLLPPTSTPSRKSNSQMRMVMKRWMPFKRCLRSRKPATIPVSMSPMTVNIFYYSFEKRGKDNNILSASSYLCVV